MKYFEPSLAALRLVPKIVQTGRLTQAASELHISQSAASHALSSLESQLGSRLFVREHEGLRLSEAGQRLLPLIEDALSTIERIRAEAVGLSAFETGNLRVAAVPSLLSTILPPILREYGATRASVLHWNSLCSASKFDRRSPAPDRRGVLESQRYASR